MGAPPISEARLKTPVVRRASFDPWLIPAALLPIIPIVALLRPGIAATSDGLVHLLRTLQVAELMKSGALYPQWAPDFYFGYGYPFFLFYAPGAHMLAAFLSLLGLGVIRSLVAVQVLSLLLASIGAYLAARSLFRGLAHPATVSMAALGAAVLYDFTPLRMRELFSQGNLSQLLALSILPWCLWALIAAGRGAHENRWRAVAGAGVLLAALLYAHHPTAFLAYPLLGLLALAVALLEGAQHRWRAVGAAVASFMLALLLSAPFVVPWVLESSYGSLGRMETGPFNASLNLVPWDQLFAPAAILDAASINSPRPYTLGLLQAVLAALGVGAALILIRRHRQPPGAETSDFASDLHTRPLRMDAARSSFLPSSLAANRARVLLVVAALLAGCLVLMLPLAAPLWTHLPLAKFIAFPWRLLGPAALLAALMAATPLLLLPERAARAGMLLLILLAPLSVAAYLFPPASLWRPAPAGGLTLADIGRYESSTGGSRGTASANEYLPRWVEDPDPPLVMLQDYEAGRLPDRLDAASLPPGSERETVQSTGLEHVYRLNLAQPANVVIRSFYYPGWRAWIDGREAAVSPGSPYGLITVAVPAGAHELRVAWGTTWPRTAGWALFAAGVAGVFFAAVAGAKNGHKRRREDARQISASPWLAAAVILAVAALKILWVEPQSAWFRLESPVDAPRSMTHPLHARFANGVELLGYDMPQDAVRQGGQLAVRLYWRTHEDLDENLSSFVHLVSPAAGVTWANLTKEQAGDMPSRSWPTGFYVVDDFRLSVSKNTPPVRATIKAGLVDKSGQRVPLVSGEDTVTIGQVAVKDRLRLPAPLPNSSDVCRLGEHITLLGYSAAGEAEGRVRLTLYWRTDDRLSVDYSIFAQAVDKTGVMMGQADGPACDGACPATSWTPGSIIQDTRLILLPAGTPTDGLHILVGVYDLATGERLPVRDSRGADRPDRAIRIPVQSSSGP